MIYKVVFEQYENKFRLAGVASNNTDMGKIAGTISSKGPAYTAVIINYVVNTILNDEFYVVYTKYLNSMTDSKYTFQDAVISEGDGYPSEKDIFLYKIEKSAINRVEKLNEELAGNDKQAVMLTMKLNTIYNV